MAGLNLRKEFRITDLDFAEKYELFSELQQVMEMYECTRCPELARHVCAVFARSVCLLS